MAVSWSAKWTTRFAGSPISGAAVTTSNIAF